MEATDLMVWGFVIHLIVDWLGQNEWQALNKMKRRTASSRWWDRHPAGFVHAGLHGWFQLLVFPWWGALFIAITHFLIDTRVPVAWWSKEIGQSQPDGLIVPVEEPGMHDPNKVFKKTTAPLYDMGTEVRIWADQVWHIGVIAVLALFTAGL